MLEYVETTISKGRTYYYYRRNKQRVKLPVDPTALEFIEAYRRTHASFEGKQEPHSFVIGSVSSLIEAFKRSTEYSSLKPNVKYLYGRSLDLLQNKIGKLPARGITRRVFLDWRDTMAEEPSKANNFIATASRLWGFGIDRGIVSANPLTKIKKLKIGEWRPWTEEEIKQFQEKASSQMSLALSLALYTGQRLSDVIKMRWNQIIDNGLEICQQKTGEKIWVPLHSSLQSLLPTIPKHSVMILTTQAGKPYKADYLKHQFKDTCRAAGLPEDCVFHGLRKTAAVMLAEAGCSTEQIKSITGHRTDQMIAHYTKKANQRVMARAAIDKLEFGTKKVTS